MRQQVTLCALGVAIGVGVIGKVNAHGYMDFPKARQAICQEQGGFWWPKDGSKIPNAACRAAYLKSEHVQFIQKHEFAANTADFRNQAAVEANIPDGTLCGAGDSQKAGMNIPSTQWQATEIKPNANGKVKIRYRATTPHNPSFWQFYLTKPGTDFKQKPLAWNDLELVQEHGNIAFFMAPDGKRYYEMEVAIPEKFSGDAILYSRWQRDDVVGEGFYNCSDVTIVRGTEPTPTPDTWFPVDYFVKQGQEASAGDTVWVRVFNGNGNELIQERFDVTSANETHWQSQFALNLNTQFADIVRIGVKDSSGNIEFNPEAVSSNQVFLSDKSYSYNLSVISKPKNTAPTVHTPAPITIDEKQSKHLHVHAFDDEQPTLNFDWQLPSALSFTGAGSTITITAPQVEEDTRFDGKVTVSDGSLSKTVPLIVNVKNIETDPGTPDKPTGDTWVPSKIYTAGDTVVYQGKTYRAKWWVRGQLPTSSHAWELVPSGDDSDAGNTLWQSSKAYRGGEIVTFNGVRYQARWWTRNQQPDQHSVWKKL
ncbi:chitinase [Pseudoalteromonas luteoviolacea]|uniref:Chitinase n=1 Tax=Pseudoalteromonas luteoviolacea TaxID=43657 RepID=A0A0C1Q6N8_9GAMM|nr:lytic polysaccharide monooxygenase [Pseudoalteromonas luteoviolacea]KID56321.1 chitinase [Pseudoalteromonas luteoviolacea]